ncbi:uncharacterized protein LOC130668173 isoform X1 [Microplitis mediator]|uniref:uncharacterized protein LOC130668173 isoform X1 n=1 Tax=Microplitis mediator TaxID=375433 RepID=UPI002555B999|nr:uncharacterized protein LOC130668173 isoform X1 [Microplitis mediator]
MEREIAIARINAILTELITQVKKKCCTSNVCESPSNKERSSRLENLIKMLDVLGRIIEMRMRTSPKEERERASALASALVDGEKARVEAESKLEKSILCLELRTTLHQILLFLSFVLLPFLSCLIFFCSLDLKSTIETEKILHQHFINDIKGQIAEEKILLEGIKAKQKWENEEKKKKTEEIIENITEKKLIEEKKIQREINLKSAEYEAIYEINKTNEEDLYNMRKTAERNYLEILAKYDKDVGMLYRTMESLIEESNELEVKLKILENKVSVQEKEYEELKNERELSILKAFTETLDNFKRNRAAKIIQRAWRGYLERQLLRKKKKSKKKK